jgi:hypothetical protein
MTIRWSCVKVPVARNALQLFGALTVDFAPFCLSNHGA